MKDYKRGKVIRLNDNSEYLICDNVLMKNEEYFLLLNKNKYLCILNNKILIK